MLPWLKITLCINKALSARHPVPQVEPREAFVLPWRVLTEAARCFVQPPAAPLGGSTPARVGSLAPAAGTPSTREPFSIMFFVVTAGMPGCTGAGKSRCCARCRSACGAAVAQVEANLPCPPSPHPPAAMVGGSPLRAAALSAAPRLPNGSLPAAAAAASPAVQPAMSTLVLLDTIGQVCLRHWLGCWLALAGSEAAGLRWREQALLPLRHLHSAAAQCRMQQHGAGVHDSWLCVIRLLSLSPSQACLAADLPPELRGHPEFAFLAPDAEA